MATHSTSRPVSPPLSDNGSNCEKDVPGNRFERPLGDTEISYFLPSRESGVNDMHVPKHMLGYSYLI